MHPLCANTPVMFLTSACYLCGVYCYWYLTKLNVICTPHQPNYPLLRGCGWVVLDGHDLWWSGRKTVICVTEIFLNFYGYCMPFFFMQDDYKNSIQFLYQYTSSIKLCGNLCNSLSLNRPRKIACSVQFVECVVQVYIVLFKANEYGNDRCGHVRQIDAAHKWSKYLPIHQDPWSREWCQCVPWVILCYEGK